MLLKTQHFSVCMYWCFILVIVKDSKLKTQTKFYEMKTRTKGPETPNSEQQTNLFTVIHSCSLRFEKCDVFTGLVQIVKVVFLFQSLQYTMFI